ncbi:MAG: antiterminator LoaP [Lachnospiraceae bacterium]|nr:antiterminator LoaP [Lachnospiraceae bacterium]
MLKNELYWYILFVRTGDEECIVKRLVRDLEDKDCLPFVPKKTRILRRQGKKTLIYKTCFPGYVFIESHQSSLDFIKNISPIIRNIKNAYRFLSYGDKDDIAMHEEERVFFSNLINDEHCIDVSHGYKEGDSIRVTSGPLVGRESFIVKTNKRRNEATIETSLFGTKTQVTLEMSVIERICT